MAVEVYSRFAVIKEGEDPKVETPVENDEKEQRVRQWIQEAAWIYPSDDERFFELLKKNLKKHFGGNCHAWQNEDHLKSGKYPQYLCSADLRGIGGDVVHLWRDGQTWWPIAGDYSLKDEEMAEVILRVSIIEWTER